MLTEGGGGREREGWGKGGERGVGERGGLGKRSLGGLGDGRKFLERRWFLELGKLDAS